MADLACRAAATACPSLCAQHAEDIVAGFTSIQFMGRVHQHAAAQVAGHVPGSNTRARAACPTPRLLPRPLQRSVLTASVLACRWGGVSTLPLQDALLRALSSHVLGLVTTVQAVRAAACAPTSTVPAPLHSQQAQPPPSGAAGGATPPTTTMPTNCSPDHPTPLFFQRRT